jgi:tetratricopeptide (TPR) repeat protein
MALLTMVFLLTGCPAEQQRTDPQIGAPVALALPVADDDLAGLLKELLESARADPQSAALRGRLAMAYEVNGYPAAALTTYEQAQALAPNEFSWPYFLALLLGKQGEHEAALLSVDRSLAIDNAYVPAWLWRGSWLLEQGRFDAATTTYQRAATLGAGPLAGVGLARTLLRQHQSVAAAAILEPISSEFRHPYIFRLLGQAYRSLGRSEDARIAFARGRQAQAFQWPDPRHAAKQRYVGGFTGRLVRAEKLLMAGGYEQALEMLEALLQLRANDPALLTNLSLAYTRVGRPERARSVLLRGLEVHPDNYYLHLYSAGVFQELGNQARALQHMQRAIEIIPERGSGHERLGTLLMQLDRYEDALISFDKALRYGVKHTEKVLYTVGMIERDRQRWPQAVERFEQTVRIDASFTLAYVYLGHCLGESGRFAAARAALAWAERLATHPTEVAAMRQRLAELAAPGASRSQ